VNHGLHLQILFLVYCDNATSTALINAQVVFKMLLS